MAKSVRGLHVILLGIAIAGAAVTVRYRSDMRSIREHIDSLGSRVADTDCGPIEYARKGDGNPVLVVHGNAGGFDQGLMMANKTIDPEFQVIAVSRFGYLRSPMPPKASVAMQADAFACLLDYLDIRQAAVVAYSAGSASTIQFALRHPERVSGLILVSPAAPGWGPIMPEPIFNIFFRNDFAYWATMTFFGSTVEGTWAGVPGGRTLTPEEKADTRTLLTGILPVSARANGSSFDTYVSSPGIFNSSESSDYPFGTIEAPTVIISAVDDPLALHENARALAKQIPRAQMVAIPDGGHPLLGHFDEVKREITQFLHRNAVDLDENR